MATAGTEALITTSEEIFREEDRGCTSFMVHCLAGSSNAALVNVPGLHASGEFFPIPKGSEYTFTLNKLGIKTVNAKGDGGAASINYGVVDRTS